LRFLQLPDGSDTMNLRQLANFLAVADTANMSRASGRVHLSQSALSRQITQLEDALGVALFRRSGAGMVLTDAGVRLRDGVAPLLRSLQEVARDVRDEPDVLRGEVSVGIPPSLRRTLLLPFLAAMRTTLPEVFCRVDQGTTATMRELAVRGDVDFAVISDVERPVGLRTQPLLDEPVLLVGPPGSLGRAATVKPERLRTLPLIVTPPRNSLRILVDRALGPTRGRGRVAAPQFVAQVTVPEVMLDLVAAGAGFAVLPRCALALTDASPPPDARPIAGMRIGWVLATARDRPPTRAAQRAMELLRGCAAGA
jgi:DNA-binding transcriptional LysR family regulator